MTESSTRKLLRRCLPAVLLVCLMAGEAGAARPPACGLYQGEDTEEALVSRETAIVESLQNGGGQGLYCEWAHIDFRLSRMHEDRRVEFLNRCIDHADRAISGDPGAGTGYFIKGLCLGKQGEAEGIWASLKIIDPFRENMEAAVRMSPEVEEGGPHRALGRLYYELPFFLGGDLKKSIQHLEQAVHYGPGLWENHFYLAQSYYKHGDYQNARNSLRQAIEICSRQDLAEFKHRRVAFEGLMEKIQSRLQ